MNYSKKACSLLFARYCSKTIEKKTKVSDIAPVTQKRSKNAYEIIKHFSGSKFFQDNLNYVDNKYLDRKIHTPKTVFIADKHVAKNIVKTIKFDLIKNSNAVFEANPGFGLLTRELLKLDLPKICLFETDTLFKKRLNLLISENQGRLKLYNTNLFNIWKITVLEQGKKLQGLMEDIPVTEWKGNPCVQIIGILASPKFLQNLMASIVFRQGITTYGRPELFLLLSPIVYCSIMKPNAGTLTLFNVFFECQCLMEVDNKSLLPWTHYKPKTTKKLTNFNIDSTKFYLIKATAKRNIYETINPEFMKPFWFFVKNVIRGRRHRVVPQMEKWIPDCGPRLIAKGIGAYTSFGDLNSNELMELFLDFISWPEFESSPFLSVMEDYLMKSDKDKEEEATSDLTADGTDFLQEQNEPDLSDQIKNF